MLSQMNKQTFLAEIRATREPLAAVVGTLADDALAEPLPDMNGWTPTTTSTPRTDRSSRSSAIETRTRCATVREGRVAELDAAGC